MRCVTLPLGDWLDVLERAYDPRWAEAWDAVGLVTGDPAQQVIRAHLAIDPVEEVVDEAERRGATLLVTHHPLLLQGVHGVAETSYKGRLVSRLVRGGIALYVAHTNADVASPGVSDALAGALGVRDCVPLEPARGSGAKVVVFVPSDSADAVVDAMAAAGAGVIGDYTRCVWTTEGTGSFVAGDATDPAVGRPGEATSLPELRVEMTVPPAAVDAVVAAMRTKHPYEEPAYDVIPTTLESNRGLGRIGALATPETLGAFAARLADVLPTAPVGVRVAGDLQRAVRRVAVCGGAGDGAIDAALAAGADAYVTGDLRHHVTREAVERGLALVDVGHWASERPWLDDARDLLVSGLAARGRTVEVTVSDLVTDPWTAVHPGRTT